nr:hypothetical protein [Syntrophomonas wolfei]
MNESGKPMLLDDKDALLAKVESLRKQIYRQQMELDILNKANFIRSSACFMLWAKMPSWPRGKHGNSLRRS